MPAPIISIFNADNATERTAWDIGDVKATDASPTLEVVIWNNKAGAAAVSDMKESSITCLDGSAAAYGGDTSEMVVGKWMKVQTSFSPIDATTNQKSFAAIGGTTVQVLRGESINAAAGDILKGAVNDGTLENATGNHCKAKLKIEPPANATEGLHEFIIRVQGFYT